MPLLQDDLPTQTSPLGAAEAAPSAPCPPLPPDLHYVVDDMPGISRKRLRGRFAYFLPGGERIRDPDEIQRINRLAIPPAYTDVWICPDPQGRREIRDSTKYERMLAFGQALPRLRSRLEKHQRCPACRARRSWRWW